MVGVAVKVTLLPAQTLVVGVEITTEVESVGLTVMAILDEVAVVAAIQVGNVPPAVCLALITSPLVGR